MKKLLILITTLVAALTLTLMLSGCSGGNDDFEGKNIVTFDVNGGILNYGTSSTKTSVNFVYYPGTYILDPAEDIPNYSISRNGYEFTGWYTDPECTPTSKWNFENTFDTATLTLYAGWEKSIRFTYSVLYKDGDYSFKLGEYSVSTGEVFEDWKDFGNERDGYTCIGYYSDAECTVPWDFTTTHPGGDSDLDVPVYVKHIEGEWELVGSYAELRSAVNRGNVYLTADIDCEGKEFSVGTYGGIFQGNGHKISNFTVNKSGTVINPVCAIFGTLTEEALITEVIFENVNYVFNDIKESTASVTVTANVAALASKMRAGARVENVHVSGKITTNYKGELPCLNSVYFYNGEADADVMAGVSEFYADITVDNQ